MNECRQIDPLVTPYVDEVLAAPDRDRVERHLVQCNPCRRRVRAEQQVRALLCDRRGALARDEAPAALRARCAEAARKAASRRRPSAWRARLAPLALAASLVAIVGGAFVYELTAHSTELMAAELAADHIKCFRLVNPILGTRPDPAAVEASMAARFDWPVRLPLHPERAGLELVGARPCLYGLGLAAHLMYRHRGHPVSVFMLPRSTRGEQLVEVLGHHAAIWSVGTRTFVLVTEEPRPDVEQMTSYIHAALR